jgi:hypothetical protein
MENTLWKIFEETGNIEAYLSYTKFRDYKSHHKESQQEGPKEHKQSSII